MQKELFIEINENNLSRFFLRDPYLNPKNGQLNLNFHVFFSLFCVCNKRLLHPLTHLNLNFYMAIGDYRLRSFFEKAKVWQPKLDFKYFFCCKWRINSWKQVKRSLYRSSLKKIVRDVLRCSFLTEFPIFLFSPKPADVIY